MACFGASRRVDCECRSSLTKRRAAIHLLKAGFDYLGSRSSLLKSFLFVRCGLSLLLNTPRQCDVVDAIGAAAMSSAS